jgi:hypothetical protein
LQPEGEHWEGIEMSEIIDIEIVVDTANLLASINNPSQNPSAPTPIGHNYAYMVAPNEFVRSGQASGDLSISADVGDTVRWRMVSQSGNTSYSANLQNIVIFSGTQVTSTTGGKLLNVETPVPGTTPGNITLPPTFSATPQYDFYLTADIVQGGTGNYNVSFAVLQYHSGSLQVLGYFVWDPTITAS